MTNVFKVKSQLSVTWIVQLGCHGECVLESEPFIFRNRKCNLLYSRSKSSWNKHASCHTSYLYFKSNGEMESPVKVIAFLAIPSKTFDAEIKTISNRNKVIWSDSRTSLLSELLTVEVIFQEEHQDDNKSVQTPSYIDTRFSLEGSSKDFTKLLDNGPNHDVEFVFGDQIIKAHKSILCCRSDVFTSMFQSDMVEGNTGRVNIQDMDVTIFRQFLEYLYTGMLSELTVDIAVQLYVTSNKYAVNILKLQCAEFLIHNLSLENACEILVLADLHNDVQFKESVMEYIFNEKLPVELEKEKWSNFCNENKDLALEVYDSFCRYTCQK